jgi:hypothetical protein
MNGCFSAADDTQLVALDFGGFEDDAGFREVGGEAAA